LKSKALFIYFLLASSGFFSFQNAAHVGQSHP
jgi:hypothetical protein